MIILIPDHCLSIYLSESEVQTISGALFLRFSILGYLMLLTKSHGLQFFLLCVCVCVCVCVLEKVFKVFYYIWA